METYNRDEVVAYVNSEVKKIKAIQIRESGDTYSLIKAYAQPQPDGAMFYLVYGNPSQSDEQKTILFFLDNMAFDSPDPEPVTVVLSNGNFYTFESESEQLDNLFARGTIPLNVIDHDNYIFTLSGELLGPNGKTSISFETTELNVLTLTGMGNASITVSGTEAIIEGELGVLSYSKLEELQISHPEVTTLVLKDISGSVNGAVNLHAGYLIHNAGYRTRLYADSVIASGGVDLFLAGTERIVESGAKVGVHSWCCVGGISAKNLPELHPAHHDYLQYYTTLYGESQGKDMYYFIINAADSDSIYWMTEKDLTKWNFVTRYDHAQVQGNSTVN